MADDDQHPGSTITTKEFRERVEARLAPIQKAAQAWGTLQTGFLAVVTAVLFIKGPESVFDIPLTNRRWLAGVLGVALLSGGVSTWLGFHAAFSGGARATTPPAHVRTQEELDTYLHDETRSAATHLFLAQLLAFLMLAAFAAGIGITWFAPKSPPAFVDIVVMESSQEKPYCGELLRFDEGTLKVKVDEEHTPTFSAEQLKSMKLVESCEETDVNR
jgi:hypothetical protein